MRLAIKAFPSPVVLHRHNDAVFLNRVLNDVSVKPWVSGPIEGDLDMSMLVADPNNVLLMGEHGGVLFHQIMQGCYEIHTQVLPEGRGAWCLEMIQRAFHWMFTKTDAVEILTRCPRGNLPAIALTKRSGLSFEFTRPLSWIFKGKPVDVDVYSISVQKWITIDGAISLRGRWAENKIKKELRKQSIEFAPQDVNRDRYVGAAFEMLLAGQVSKGIALYNRWASMANVGQATVLSDSPLSVDFRGVVLVFRHNDFWVMSCR